MESSAQDRCFSDSAQDSECIPLTASPSARRSTPRARAAAWRHPRWQQARQPAHAMMWGWAAASTYTQVFARAKGRLQQYYTHTGIEAFSGSRTFPDPQRQGSLPVSPSGRTACDSNEIVRPLNAVVYLLRHPTINPVKKASPSHVTTGKPLEPCADAMLLRDQTPLHHCCEPGSTAQRVQAASRPPHRHLAARATPLQASMLEERRKRISDSIRQVPDFPKKGILFHDVTTLLLDPQVCG